MTNDKLEKLVIGLIDKLGFDVEEVKDIKRYYLQGDLQESGEPKTNALPESIITNIDYKLTKKKVNISDGMEEDYIRYADAACKFENDSCVPMYILTRQEFFARRKGDLWIRK